MEVISADELNYILIVVNVVLGGIVCFCGIFLNLINIFVFWKQSFGQTVNISMFAIAVSDLCSLVTLVWMNINLNPFMENSDIPYEPFDIIHFTGTWPHYCFFQITIWITVYVTAERLVCIALPLKVKQIFTPLRTKVAISLIFLLTILTLLPVYTFFEFGETFNTSRNETRFVLKVRDMNLNLNGLALTTYIVLEITSFVGLTVITCLLVVALKRRLKWRKSFSADRDQGLVMSRSGTRTIKMVGLISGALIVCSAPGVIVASAQRSIYHIIPGEQNNEVFQGFWSIAHLAEAVTGSINTVLFYKMSSKYKQHFDNIVSQCTTWCRGYKRTKRGAV